MEGYYVYGVDNLLTGLYDNISHLESDNNFEFIEHDVTKHIEFNDKLDFVLHFASPDPIDYLKYPIETLKANAIGGYNLLGLAKKNS